MAYSFKTGSLSFTFLLGNLSEAKCKVENGSGSAAKARGPHISKKLNLRSTKPKTKFGVRGNRTRIFQVSITVAKPHLARRVYHSCLPKLSALPLDHDPLYVSDVCFELLLFR